MPSLRDIATLLNVALDPADAGDRTVVRVASLEDAGPDDLAYVASAKYLDRLAACRAGVIVAPLDLAIPAGATTAAILRVRDVELAIGVILTRLAPPACRPPVGVHPSAVVDPTATVAPDAAVGPNAVVGAMAHVGARSTLHAGVVVGDHARVGDDCELFANVVLRERVVLGDRVILHAGAIVGTDGFGYRWDGKKHAKVPQIGTVVIEDDVEVGSGTCIDRAKFGETRVGRGTKIDNLVQVGHNAAIGAHCILCGQVGLAGSTTLGNGVVMGGNSASAGHVRVADGTMLAARGAFINDTKPGQVLAGAPAIPHRDFLREQAALRTLPDLIKRLRHLEAEVERLKNSAYPPSTP